MKSTCLLILVVATIMQSGASNQTTPVKCPAWNLPGIRIKVPHQDRCEMYYKCVFGLPHLRICPMEGKQQLHFNPRLKICDLPSNAGCGNSTDSPVAPVAPAPTCPPSGNHKIPDPDTCNYYFLCENGKKLEDYGCCNEGRFDTPTKKCLKDGVRCSTWSDCPVAII